MNRFGIAITMMLALHAGSSMVRAADLSSDTKHLRSVFSREVFASVNPNDALASSKVWIETVGRRQGLDVEVETDAYDGLDDLRRRIADARVDLIIANSLDFHALEQEQIPIEPVFVPRQADFIVEDYLVLTSSKTPANLSALRGRQVLFLKTTGANLARPWIDVLLTDRGWGTAEDFFGNVQEVSKPSAAILPVFFGKADACVVDRSSFQLMDELNPQVGARLTVCTNSPPFLETVICIRRGTDLRDPLVKGLTSLHQEPAGQQLLMVFKISELEPFQSEFLDSVRELQGHRAQLAASTPPSASVERGKP